MTDDEKVDLKKLLETDSIQENDEYEEPEEEVSKTPGFLKLLHSVLHSKN